VPQGFDFAMTAMFVCILPEQLLSGIKNLPSVIIGIAGYLVSLPSVPNFGEKRDTPPILSYF